MNGDALRRLVPRPLNVVPDAAGSVLPLARFFCAVAPEEWSFAAAGLERINRDFALPPGSGVAVTFTVDRNLAQEAWRLRISAAAIDIAGGGGAGGFYALTALAQLTAAATAKGERTAALDCGTIHDVPRFAHRGFMLDSARHFQSVATLKKVLRLLAAYRINVFHWHLTDNHGYRVESAGAPELQGIAELDAGYYSAAEIREVCEFARALFITVIPELDMPGHSRGVCTLHPELACRGVDAGREYCLGKPEVENFLRARLTEWMELFPDSRYIHLGGDEARTQNWEACPDCRAALAAAKGSGFRELENVFMKRMCEFVHAAGRRPVVWGTEGCYPEYVTIQAYERPEAARERVRRGNPTICSLDQWFYWDYPESAAEPHEEWMPILSLPDAYAAAPFDGWTPVVPGQFLGVEACLWTETVPERRVLAKIAGRLGAYAEVAWSPPELKCFSDFQQRRIRLDHAGIADFLRFL